MNDKQRIIFIDIARGIGIILVVLGHVISPWEKPFNSNEAIRNYIYSFHMALFFVISGVLVYYSLLKRELTKEYLKIKTMSLVEKLLIPYYLWSCIYFILSHESLTGSSDIYEWIICIITFRGRAPIWFLGTLFWTELIALFMLFKLKDLKRSIGITTIIIAFTAIIASMFYSNASIHSLLLDYIVVSFFRGFISLFFVLVGYLAAPYILQKRKLWKQGLVTIVAFSFTVLLYFVFNNKCNFHTFTIKNMPVFLLTGILGSFQILFLASIIASYFKTRILNVIGKNTMGIMCMHYMPLPFIQYSADICYRFELSGSIAFLVTFFFVFGSSFLSAIILKKCRLVI